MAYATQVIQEAFPEYEVVWGSHGDYGGGRAPRDHTLSFRLRDRWGKFHSNVIWVFPECLSSITGGNRKEDRPRFSEQKRGQASFFRSLV